MKILSADYVLPIIGEPIRDGAVAIQDHKIVEVGTQKALLKKQKDAEHKNFGSAALMPGLVNCDTHLESLSFDYTGREPNFIDWLVARLDHQAEITPVQRRANLKEGLQKLARSGTTLAGDVGNYSGSFPELTRSPLRLILFPEILTGAEKTVAEHYQATFDRVDEIRSQDSKNLSAGLAPYSAYTLSRHLLKIIASHAQLLKIPVKIHVAESFAEMQFFYESSGEIAERIFPKLGWEDFRPPEHRKTPVQFLESIGFLASHPILVGCLHLADRDFQTIAKRKCRVVWSPRTQKYLKLGEAPIQRLKKEKIAIGLGTDGTGSRHSLSLWDEMRAGLGLCAPDELLEIATIGGAQVLGREKELGSIEPGKMADLVAIKIPSDTKPSKLAAQLVEKTTEREIEAVFIDGQEIGA